MKVKLTKLNFIRIILKHTQAMRKINMKTHLKIFLLIIFITSISISQNNNTVKSEVKNNDVKIKLHNLIEFNDAKAGSGNKFLIADITIENISPGSIEMGAEYTMSINLKDAAGNEYRSGLKGAGIISFYLTKTEHEKQDQKAYNLCFGDNFPST